MGWPPWEDYNRDGLRDREHTLAKPKGVRRVISLGDSTTLGWRLRPEEAYPQVLQDRASALGHNLEVFNVALGGWSTRQELIAYRRIARAYHPDIVLLGICLNDFAEMQNNLARPPAWLAALHLRSALVRRIVRAEDREIGSIEELFAEPPSPRVEDGFRRVFADVRAVRDDVKADGGELVVLLLPYRQQVEPGAPPGVPQRRVAEFCAREKIRFLDLLPALRGTGDSGFIDPVHLSATGARQVAEAVLQSGVSGEAEGDGSEASARNTAATAARESLRKHDRRSAHCEPRQRASRGSRRRGASPGDRGVGSGVRPRTADGGPGRSGGRRACGRRVGHRRSRPGRSRGGLGPRQEHARRRVP